MLRPLTVVSFTRIRLLKMHKKQALKESSFLAAFLLGNRGDRMSDKRNRGIWNCIYPILIYWLVQSLAYSVVVTAIVMRTLDVTDNTITYEQVRQLVITAAENHAATVYYVSMLLTGVVLIPLFLHMYRKDIRLRKTNAIDAIETVRTFSISKVCYLFPVLLSGAAVIAGNGFIVISKISLQSEAFLETQSVLYGGNIFLEIVGAGIVAPILEELLFRLLIYQRLKEQFPVIYALILNAVLFGILHGNIVQGLYGGLMGAIFCYGYERYQDAKIPIVMHCFGNLLALFLSHTGIADVLFGNMVSAYSAAAISALLLVIAVYLIEAKVAVQGKETDNE